MSMIFKIQVKQVKWKFEIKVYLLVGWDFSWSRFRAASSASRLANTSLNVPFTMLIGSTFTGWILDCGNSAFPFILPFSCFCFCLSSLARRLCSYTYIGVIIWYICSNTASLWTRVFFQSQSQHVSLLVSRDAKASMTLCMQFRNSGCSGWCVIQSGQ